MSEEPAASPANRPFRMMTVGSEAKLSVCSDSNLTRNVSEEEDDEDCLAAAPPPDGGWGWVVVLAGFMVHFLLDGIGYTFGLLLSSLVEDFKSEAGTVVWAGSLLVGVNMLSGPLVGGLVNRFGCRPVAILGSLVGSAALALSTVCTNITTFIIIYGFLGGLGFGMVFLPAIVCVGMYFQARRALATGMCVCGAGAGAFVFAPIANVLVETVGWRTTNLVFSGLCLLNVMCGLAMRPLEAVTGLMTIELPDGSKIPSDGRNQALKNIDLLPTIGENDIFDKEEEDENDVVDINANNSESSIKANSGKMQRNMSLNLQVKAEKMDRNYSTPYLRPVPSSLSVMSMARKDSATNGKIVKPMSRLDIFYSGSIRNIEDENLDTETLGLKSNRQSFVSFGALPKGKSQASLMIGRNSLVSQNSLKRNSLVSSHSLASHPEKEDSIKNVMKNMLDPTLLKDPKFLLIGISNLFGFLGFFIPFIYLPSMAADTNAVTADQAAFLLSVIGVSNTIGRILCGFVADFAWVDSLCVINISFLLSAACVFTFPFLSSFTEFVILSLIFGVCIASLVTLTSIVLVDVLGLPRLTSAFGLLTMFRGLATMMGPPLAGLVYQAAASYSPSFYLAGSFFLVAGLVSLLADLVRRREVTEQTA